MKRRVAAFAILFGALSSCVGLSGAFGNDLRGPSTVMPKKSVSLEAMPLKQLTRKARGGDKHAQLEMGIRYENGRGVPVNLVKARELYFKAATKKGALIPTYVATPGGRSGSIMNYHNAPTELSGLEEAVVRWARVSDKIAKGKPQKQSRQDLNDYHFLPDDITEARDELVRIYGYQPIFNELKYRKKTWQENIVKGGGARLMSREQINHSFLFALEPPLDIKLGAEISAEKIEAFCAKEIVGSDMTKSAYRRMAGLCATHRCDLISDKQWNGITTKLSFRNSKSQTKKKYGPIETSLFQDSSFLLRVASLCKNDQAVVGLTDIASNLLDGFSKMKVSCAKPNCDSGIRHQLNISQSAIANILFWSLEASQHDNPLVRQASKFWVAKTAEDMFAVPVRDDRVVELCTTIREPYKSCRKKYPYGYFLDRNNLDLSNLLSSIDLTTDERLAIKKNFYNKYLEEFLARNETIVTSNLR